MENKNGFIIQQKNNAQATAANASGKKSGAFLEDHRLSSIAQRKLNGALAGENTNHSTANVQLKSSAASSEAPVQMINVGYIPSNPGAYRTVTTLGGYSGNTVRGDKAFNNSQRDYVYQNNIANGGNHRAMPVPQGGVPGNDSTQNGAGLINRDWASQFEPEVDHIVERQNGGANDYRNARIISKNNNTNGQMNRPNRGGQDLKIYTGITVSKATPAPQQNNQQQNNQQQNNQQQNNQQQNNQQPQLQVNSYYVNGGSTLNQASLDDIYTYGTGQDQQNINMNLGNNQIDALDNLQLGAWKNLGNNRHIRIS